MARLNRSNLDLAPALTPQVETGCVVCGSATHILLTSAAEIRQQHDYLRRFHRRRVRSGSAAVLEERAEFTQDYDTNIVVCARCNHLFRDPRPPAAAIAAAYKQDRTQDHMARGRGDIRQ